jgi:hypothetical protein
MASRARHAGYMRPAQYQVVMEKSGYQPYVLLLQAELEQQYFAQFIAVCRRSKLGGIEARSHR